MRRKSYCLILLDEIEKAHPDVFNMLLQIFDDGSLTDAKGRKVDFRNTIIIMTSNVGSDLIRRESVLGFSVTHGRGEDGGAAVYRRMKDKVTEELKRVFRPEFLNRIDARSCSTPWPRSTSATSSTWSCTNVAKNLLLKGISMEVTDAARDWLGEKGYDPVFGARPLRRVIQNELEDRLSEALLEGRFGPGDTVLIDVTEGGEVILTTQESPALAESGTST